MSALSVDRSITLYAIVIFIVFSPVEAVLRENSLNGKRATCSNEGEAVDVKNIDRSKCYSCMCKNGYVECTNNCPIVEGCHMLENGGGCCRRCKGCYYNGKLYPSHSEFTDPKDPCKVLTCEAGVITASNLHCYTPCANPLPPEPGKCCPTCPECKINGQIAREDRDVISDDPCLKCRCSKGRMICSKKACPVLQCLGDFKIHPSGECCPRCKGTRSLFLKPQTCMVQGILVPEGQNFGLDKCTNCTCTAHGTSVCSRPSCPILDCPTDLQVQSLGSCCMRCTAPQLEERTESCSHDGNLYEDGQSWQLDPCKSCKCNQGKINCAITRCNPNLSCPPGSKLQLTPGECCAKCVDVEGVCIVFGDLHYKTFDSKIYTFNGLGRYHLTKDCSNNSFSVRVYNHQQDCTRAGGKSCDFSSMTKRVVINYGRTRINLQQRGKLGRVKINGKQVRKFPQVEAGKFKIERIDGNTEISLQNGLKFFWNGKSFLEVSAPAIYKGKLCGLCGNFNSNSQDDFTTSTREQLTDKEVQTFGHSWCAFKNKRECAKKIRAPSKYCTKHRMDGHCKYFTSSIFSPCHSNLDYSKYYKACKMDICACPEGNCYCESLMAYTRECQRLGVVLQKNQAYGLCSAVASRKQANKKNSKRKDSKISEDFSFPKNFLTNRTMPANRLPLQ